VLWLEWSLKFIRTLEGAIDMDRDEVFNKEMEDHCDVFFKWYNFCGMVAIK